MATKTKPAASSKNLSTRTSRTSKQRPTPSKQRPTPERPKAESSKGKSTRTSRIVTNNSKAKEFSNDWEVYRIDLENKSQASQVTAYGNTFSELCESMKSLADLPQPHNCAYVMVPKVWAIEFTSGVSTEEDA